MIEGLKKALQCCTKYEDHVYLTFLVRKELAKEDPEAMYSTEDID